MTFFIVLTLDISKAFNRVWKDGLLFKLKQNGVSANLLGLIKSFLSDRVQRVSPNGELLIGNVYEQVYHRDLL